MYITVRVKAVITVRVKADVLSSWGCGFHLLNIKSCDVYIKTSVLIIVRNIAGVTKLRRSLEIALFSSQMFASDFAAVAALSNP